MEFIMKHVAAVIALLFIVAGAHAGTHLFILSGQSNMAGLNPAVSFTPTVEKEFGKENVIVIKSAQGGQPIRRWYKDWKPENGDKPAKNGDLYDKMMKLVNPAIKGKTIDSVTFCWMQGERDAKEKHDGVYAASMKGLVDQLAKDLGRDDVNFVIGRLSDYGTKKHNSDNWIKVREAQVAVAEASPRGAWVDTDDLNDGKNKRGKEITDDLHYSVDGYKTFGQRLADESIKLIKKHAK
jgi:hypothetical protein